MLDGLFVRNRAWSAAMTAADPAYFHRLSEQQAPECFWIGCSDSRVPANVVAGLDPGEVFVHRNVANVVHSSDMNLLSALEYAVEALRVRHIIVCGHHGCGGVRASYLKGLATNLANPKIVVALSAMIAPLLPPSPSLGTAAVVIVALWLSAFALFAVFVQVVSTDRVRRKFLRAGPYIDIAAGAFFMVVGAVLIARGLVSVL